MLDYKIEEALRTMFRKGELRGIPDSWDENDVIDYLSSYGKALTKSSGSNEYSNWTEAFKKMASQFGKLADLIGKRKIKLLTKREARKLAHQLGKAVEDEEKEEEEEKKGYWSIFTKEELELFKTAKDAKRTDLGTYPKRTFTESRSEEVKEEAAQRVHEYGDKINMPTVDYPYHHVEEKVEGPPIEKPYEKETEEEEEKRVLEGHREKPLYQEREDDSEEKEKGFKEMAEENLAREGKEPKYKKPDKYPKKEKQPEKYPYKEKPEKKENKKPFKDYTQENMEKPASPISRTRGPSAVSIARSVLENLSSEQRKSLLGEFTKKNPKKEVK